MPLAAHMGADHPCKSGSPANGGPGRAMAQETLGQSGDGLPQPVRVENQQHGSPSSAASWAVQPPPAPPPS